MPFCPSCDSAEEIAAIEARLERERRDKESLAHIRGHAGRDGVLNALRVVARETHVNAKFGWAGDTDRKKAADMAVVLDALVALLDIDARKGAV